MDKKIISVENLSKKFGEKVVLDDISLQIMKGESIAILGSNGAGKSTFLRMICGLASISSGSVKTKHNIKFNYIPENFARLNLTIQDFMKAIAQIEKIDKQEFSKRVEELYIDFNLQSMKDIPLKHLSKGTLQKVGVIQALITTPDVLLLDEPLSGQDIDSQKMFISKVKDLLSNGVTVIMSCHEMFLVEQLSTRILQIKDKKISEVAMPEMKQIVYNTIIFENNDKAKLNIEMELEDVGEYYIDKGLLNMKVQQSCSNEIVMKLIENGYVLKSFK